MLTTLQAPVRQDLQIFLKEFGGALAKYGGAEGFRESFRTSPAAYQYTSQVNQALLGTQPGDLAGFISNLDIVRHYFEIAAEMAQRGVLQGGERLHPTTMATTVRVRDGEIVIARDGATVVVRVVENPIINRVILEGNKALKADKITAKVQAFMLEVADDYENALRELARVVRPGGLVVVTGAFTDVIGTKLALIAVLIMMFLVTDDGRTREGRALLGLHRLGARFWWIAIGYFSGAGAGAGAASFGAALPLPPRVI